MYGNTLTLAVLKPTAKPLTLISRQLFWLNNMYGIMLYVRCGCASYSAKNPDDTELEDTLQSVVSNLV